MNELQASYENCTKIAKRSGSSFYRSFALLAKPRRDAMMALYAFARLADDATDEASNQCQPIDQKSAPQWCAHDWRDWIANLANDDYVAEKLPCLQPIRRALADSVRTFDIPLESLNDIVAGVDLDTKGPVRFQQWEDTKEYCFQVASSVGVACLSIWAKNIGERPDEATLQAAKDCGVAFQLTNILRDLAEDAHRGRIYLPTNELHQFGIEPERWLKIGHHPSVFALNEIGDWRGLIRLQLERAKAHYELGWQVASQISRDGNRMFSLMWHTYRELLDQIELAPESIWNQRISLSLGQKWKLLANHVFTPLYLRQQAKNESMLHRKSAPTRRTWPENGPHVAVIGAGLAGINAALHLVRNGARVTLLESKHRIGGRVGSFVDSSSGQSIDYCQHVGMVCCTTLQEWISDTGQAPYWNEQDTLHFASTHGKRIDVRAWSLPAPFHLSGLLLRWPGLGFTDRIRVAAGLLKLLRLKINDSNSNMLAIEWLKSNNQTESCIANFWGTILVSALGEQVERVTLGATHKVLIDGFAAHRRAFHLLVPNRPLSEIFDGCVSSALQKQNVKIKLGCAIRGVQKGANGQYQLSLNGDSTANDEVMEFDSVVCAIPWHSIESILPDSMRETLSCNQASPGSMESSPITGIHTWWDRPWLHQPHAILINRLCQWVFPAPEAHSSSSISSDPAIPSHVGTIEFYYQIVISGSRMLPRGDTDAILKSVKQDLAEIFPESAVASLLRGKVVTDPNSVFSVSPGHEPSRLPCDQFGEEQIWLAGDWTNTGWPATMEGALRSGALAVEGLLASYDRATKLI